MMMMMMMMIGYPAHTQTNKLTDRQTGSITSATLLVEVIMKK